MDTTREQGTWIRRRLRRRIYERRELAFAAEILIIPLNSSIPGARAYVKRLRQNLILCMAGDGQIARRRYPVRFLGRTVTLAPGAVKLARLVGSPLLPIFWSPALPQRSTRSWDRSNQALAA